MENPQAFPISHPICPADGMTLRDYFAGQALIALTGELMPHKAAEEAYTIADAMLARREKK